jgi:hypothetical protein
MQSPKSDSEVPSNRVIFSARMSALEFHVLTRVVPLETHLIIYPEMSDHSTPAEANATVIECGADKECKISSGAEEVNVRLARRLTPPAVVVLDMQYATIEAADVRANTGSYGASWVVRLVDE